MENKHGVKPGQIWQDNDSRYRRDTEIRKVEVLEVGETHATCKNYPSGKITKIQLKRFKPNNTGYRLIKDVQGD
jgi:hypothetical protein